jgi:hypothetical protein
MPIPADAPARFAQFVYYRVPLAQREETLRAVQRMQHSLVQQWPGLQARLMQRADSDAGAGTDITWMETYAHPQGVSNVIAQAIAAQASALLEGLIGVRHVETFVPLTPLEA